MEDRFQSCVYYIPGQDSVEAELLPKQKESSRLQAHPRNGQENAMEYRMEEVNIDSASTSGCAMCSKPRRCSVVSLVAIVVILVSILGIFAYKIYSTDASKSKTSSIGHAFSQTSSEYAAVSSEGLDLRINPNLSTCEGPSCTVCKTQLRSWQPYRFEPLHCINDDNVKNGSCYLCTGTCKTFDDLQDRGQQLVCNNWPLEITCCLLSQMGNAGQICGPGGSYKCNGADTAVCMCPFGRAGDRCKEEYKENFNCNCYSPAYPFCGQEEMEDCNNENRNPDITRCHMKLSRNGEDRNCLCNKSTGEDDGDKEECTVPHTEPQTNGSLKLQYNLLIIVSMVINILMIVDKT